jgi:hypothetical protein
MAALDPLNLFQRSTIKILFVLVLFYVLIWLPYLLLREDLPDGLNAPYALLGGVQIAPIYLFNGMGVPGLLVNNGHCGWGWCSPSVFGYSLLVVFWLAVLWLAAGLTAKLTSP